MANNDIQGTITYSNGNAVQGAKVYLFSQNNPNKVKQTTTDANGDYIFKQHPDGSGSAQDWYVAAYHDDGTNEYQAFSEPGVVANISSVPVRAIDFFEGGSPSPKDPWGSWTNVTGSGSLTAQSDTIISGSFTGKQVVDSAFGYQQVQRNTNAAGDFGIKFLKQNFSGKNDDYFHPTLVNTNDRMIHPIEYRYNGNIVNFSNSNQIGTWQTGNVNTLRYNNDFANDEFEVIFNGTSLGTVNFLNSANEYKALSLVHTAQDSGTKQTVFIDNIRTFD
jgi:hypothetical protein